jgi:septal ring factor EnvC (AmiA/AmiB activator)
MKFLLLVLIIALLSAGCLPRQPVLAVPDEKEQLGAFFRFIDAETATERKQALQALQQDFPQNPLTSRATKLDQLEAARAEQPAKIKKLTSELKQCKEENLQKETDNAALRKDMEQLKQLVIEMEMRAR